MNNKNCVMRFRWQAVRALAALILLAAAAALPLAA